MQIVKCRQTKVHIKRYTLAAATLLHRATPLVGQIHSCYARIVNIQMPDGRLLTLQGPGPLQAPCAASLAEDIEGLCPYLFPGDLVAQDDKTPAALRLVATGAATWDGRLLPLSNVTPETLRDTAEKLTRWLAQHASDRGIAPVLTALRGASVRSPLHRRLCRTLTPMLDSHHISNRSMADMAAQVIGLGEGLTPSGDDLLVGFLAILHLAGHAPQLLSSIAWFAPLITNTTDLSAAFLRHALQGHFSEPIVDLVRALYGAEPHDWQANAAKLARVGHSSGVDAMVGIAIGSQLFAAAELPQAQRTN